MTMCARLLRFAMVSGGETSRFTVHRIGARIPVRRCRGAISGLIPPVFVTESAAAGATLLHNQKARSAICTDARVACSMRPTIEKERV